MLCKQLTMPFVPRRKTKTTINAMKNYRVHRGRHVVKGLALMFLENLRSCCRKSKDGEGATSRSTTPSREPKSKKQVSIDARETTKKRGGKLAAEKKDEKKAFAPRKFSRKSKLKRRRRRHDPLYFGPLIECK